MAKKKAAQLNIVFVLDMTGSMEEVKQQAISGYNEYVTTMQKSEPKASMALTTFNSAEIKVYPAAPVGKAMLLNDSNYRPNSNTPLYDAIGKTLAETEQRVAPGDKVAFVILTDGLENASKEYTKAGIFAKLKEKEAAGWGIVYLGANQDAYQAAMGLGIDQTNVAAYAAGQTKRAIGRGAGTASLNYFRTGQTGNLMAGVDKDALLDKGAGAPFKKKKKSKK